MSEIRYYKGIHKLLRLRSPDGAYMSSMKTGLYMSLSSTRFRFFSLQILPVRLCWIKKKE